MAVFTNAHVVDAETEAAIQSKLGAHNVSVVYLYVASIC
jgi:hypothetical protein